MATFALFIVWHLASGGFSASRETRLEVRRERGLLTWEDRRSGRVSGTPGAPAGPCDDGADRCNRHNGYATPGIGYRDVRDEAIPFLPHVSP